ncbi:YqiA/YcfP family alpha/beta fold hydrolase [Ruminococcus sp.]|uniref:YqiA/YcfP family alpha/beta fold hydrolase n=1 Tax=Ruminococcus sp. TaxID=41978 RepID=UPI0025EB15BD|nr:YqiA/YcfP family alpha/beta fold hydrolase [Ruminococcus sp.]
MLNLHGYGGSAENAAFAALKANGHDVVSPQNDYDAVSPREMVVKLKKLAADESIGLIVGTSLGGFYAAVLSAETGLPAVLVNPCLMAFYHLPLLGYTGDISEFIGLFGELEDLDKSRICAIIGGSDEVVTTHSFTRGYLCEERVTVIPAGKHSGATLPLAEYFGKVIK